MMITTRETERCLNVKIAVKTKNLRRKTLSELNSVFKIMKNCVEIDIQLNNLINPSKKIGIRNTNKSCV